MTLLLERNENRQIKELDHRISELVKLVRDNGGSMPIRDAIRTCARTLAISVSEMPYVVSSAVADDRLESNLRERTLSIPSSGA